MRRKISIFLICLFITSFFTGFTYSSSLSKKEIRVGLKNMQSTSINVILNGDYLFNNQVLKSGTSYMLNYLDGKIFFNEGSYDVINLIPLNGDSTIRLETGIKSYSYLGSVSFNIVGKEVIPVNTINVEDYIKGVIPYEMSESYPIEALKAQAVVARTYTIYNSNKHSTLGYDLCDTTDCQTYRGYNPALKKCIQAVNETAGEIILYNDTPAEVFYSASNGGVTETCSNIWQKPIVYLVSKVDTYDNEVWPYGDKIMSSKDIEDKLKSGGYLNPDETFVGIDMANIRYYENGRVAYIDINYKDALENINKKTLSKEKVRSFLSLNSNYYSVVYNENEDKYTFSGKGNGHGVGMSQIGAKNRAISGQTYKDIISFYFEGTKLSSFSSSSKITTFNMDKNVVNIGDQVKFKVEMNNNSVNYLYKYTVDINNNPSYTGFYTTNSSFSYTVDGAYDYTVHVYVKEVSSSNEYDEERKITFKPIKQPTIRELSISNSKIELGKSIDIKAIGENFDAAAYNYHIEILRDGVKTDSFVNGNGSIQYTPKEKGVYSIKCWIENKTSSEKHDERIASLEVIEVKQEDKKDTEGSNSKDKPDETRTIKLGISGNDVKDFQNKLKILEFYKYPSITGYYGKVTADAVSKFQRSEGLKVTGEIDNKTAIAINNMAEKFTTSSRGDGRTATKITFVGLNHTPLIEGEGQTFYISAINSEYVQYRIWACNIKTKKWEDITDGYISPVVSNGAFTISPSKSFTLGDYYFSIWVKKANQMGLNKNNNGDYDSYYTFNMKCVSKNKATVVLSGDMVTDKENYKLGDNIKISGIKNFKGTIQSYKYKLHVYDITRNKWINDIDGYSNLVSWKPTEEGKYAIDLWAIAPKSKNKFDGFKIKIINVEK